MSSFWIVSVILYDNYNMDEVEIISKQIEDYVTEYSLDHTHVFQAKKIFLSIIQTDTIDGKFTCLLNIYLGL